MGVPSVAIRRPVLTIMLFTGVVVMGVISLLRLPIELYQGQSQSVVSIVVRARGGLPPPEVEKQITKPVEEAVATVSNLKGLYSSSREAESRVTLEFTVGTDMRFAALEVREKFARVKPLLPKEIEKPVIANYDDSESAVYIFALTSQSMSPEDVRALVDAELKPLLSRVNGVATVEVYGGRERKILVEVDRDKMVAYNVSIERIMDVLGQSNVNLLAGSVDRGTLEFSVRTMGAFESVEEVGELGVQATRQGSIIPLKELATVKDAYMEPEDYARLNLEQNVTVYVKKSSMAKALQVVKDVRFVVDQFEANHKEQLGIIPIADKAMTISRAIDDVKGALYLGVILTVIILYLFLRQWILALIVFISIPVSVIATFIFMSSLGISINVMSLSGLALAVGVLVDSSVVILENIFVKKEKGMSDAEAIREGAEEVWLPLLASQCTTIIVFLPIIFIDKKIQMVYAGFSFTVVSALISSFFVAEMLVPVLMTLWAQGKIKVSGEHKAGQLMNKLNEGYSRFMKWNLKLRYPVVGFLIAACVFTTWKIVKRDIDWPKTLEENEFSIVIFPLAGARLDANDDSVRRIEALLGKIPDVEMFSSTVRKDDVRIFVKLQPRAKRTYSKEEIMKLVDEKGNESVKEIHDDYSLIVDEGATSGEGEKLVVNIFGHENEELQKLAQEFANLMGKVPGLSNIVMTDLRKRPEYSLVVDKGRAAYYGLSVKEVADSIHAQVRGMRPTKFHELSKGEEIEVITRLQAIYRQKIEDLKQVYMQTDSGKQIPLGEIANFYPSVGPQTIDRKDKYRYVFVKGDTKRPLETLGREVKEALKGVKMPDDYYWRFGGSFEELLQGKTQLSLAMIITVFLVYMVMACLFQSYLQPLLIMVSVPMASVGIWLALEIGDKPLSQNVFIGMILLAGYVVNAAIILMDHINWLMAKGSSLQAAVIQSGIDRMRPIIMTTLSTVCGFLPMALNIGQSSDLWSPLAVTVIGGLISSTVLTLFILPNFIIIANDVQMLIKNYGWQAVILIFNMIKARLGKNSQQLL